MSEYWAKLQRTSGVASCTAAAILALSSFSVVAQVPKEMEASAKKGSALLFCAVLAAESTEAIQPLASDLASRAQASLEPAMEAITDQMSDPKMGGPLGAYIAQRTPDFMIGMSLASTTTEVRKLLDEEASFGDGGSYDTIKLLRQYKAEAEFQQRNCSLL